jgi:hypothetical protein
MLKDLYIFYAKYFLYLLWNVCSVYFCLYRHDNLMLQNVYYPRFEKYNNFWLVKTLDIKKNIFPGVARPYYRV